MLEKLYSTELEERQQSIKELEDLANSDPQQASSFIPDILQYLYELPDELTGLKLVSLLNNSLTSFHSLLFSEYKSQFTKILNKLLEFPLDDENDLKFAITIQLLSLMRPQLSANQQLMQEFLPLILRFMEKSGTVQQVAYSLIAALPLTNPQLLSPYIEQLFKLIDSGFSQLSASLHSLYSLNPKAFEENIDILAKIYQQETNQRSIILNIFNEISKKNPELLIPYMSLFKDGLMSPLTSSYSAMILGEIARSYPQEVYPLVPELKRSASQISYIKTLVPNILGLIAQIGEDVAKEVLPFLSELLEGADQTLAVAVLSEFKNIADMNIELISPYVEQIRSYTEDPQEYVRDMAKAIIAKIEGRDLEAIYDKLMAQNEEIKKVVRSYDDLREYIDNNISLLKEFIADIVKKMPIPNTFSAEGKIKKTLKLNFVCGTQSERCLFPEDRPFVVETKYWSKWLKVAFSAVKIGKAIIQPLMIGDAIKGIKEIYEIYKTKEDKDFLEYIKEPFLTSQEQDFLVTQLRESKFFEVFNYNPQNGSWDCIMCYKP